MPTLIAPVFNTITDKPLRIQLSEDFFLVSGFEPLYKICHERLRPQMNENRLHFEEKVKPNSLFLYAEYPTLKVKEDRPFIAEIENRLNMANGEGVCSIPYLLTMEENRYGINYLKRSLDGPKFIYTDQIEGLFKRLMNAEIAFPTVPYRRYLLALEKKSLEDELLDLWIALESLFVPDGKKGEITYKVRTRIAYYLGQTPEERIRIANFIKNSYNHRSEVVHSGKDLGNTIKEEIQILRQISRATLINLALEKTKLQKLREQLDNLVLTGRTYKEEFSPAYFEQIVLP